MSEVILHGTAHAPVDVTARVMFAKGTKVRHRDLMETTQHSDQCLPLKMKYRFREAIASGMADLSGQKFDWLTVVGMADTDKPRWVVRCNCGQYEHRKARTLKNPPEGIINRCSNCDFEHYRKP